MESSFSQRSLIQHLADAFEAHASRTVQCIPRGDGDGGEVRRSFQELWQEAALFGQGLKRLGCKEGDPILVLSENNPRWLVADLALLGLGCPSVPRGTEAPAEEIAYMLGKVRAHFAIVEKPRFLKSLALSRTPLKGAILLQGEPEDAAGDLKVWKYEEVLAQGDQQTAVDFFHKKIARREADDVATIVFTSGTTGQPKGVTLTQANLASNLLQTIAVIHFMPAGGGTLSILPPWHMFERMVEYALLDLGLHIIYTDRRHFAADLKHYQPDVLAAVPRLWVLLMDGLFGKLAEAPLGKRLLVKSTLRLATWQVQARRVLGRRTPALSDLRPGPLQSLGTILLGMLSALPLRVLRPRILGKIQQALGIQNLHRGAGISGGGTLPPHVGLFFEALGTPLLNGYGLTETSPVLNLTLRDRIVSGTVGPALPQTAIQIRNPENGSVVNSGEQGVVFARGPQIMWGYFEDPASTRKVLGEDGWFNTGDLGRLAADGQLLITGRAKDTIVLLSGENIDPEPLENALTASPFIEQAVVVGQDQKFLGALIVPSADNPGPLATTDSDKLTSAISGGELYDQIRREIDSRVNPRKGFRQHERIVRFQLVEQPFSVEDGSLSQTMKIKRPIIHKRHVSSIESMFDK